MAANTDIKQLFFEARRRWLRPAEICTILRSYQKFHIATEPPSLPPSGSLFLFDRKVLRYFRKDGHNWRKKKDGKTVKEAHEKLKVGSVDVLHCYYAHGEDNENFQRRCYWMLEEELMHVVFVHYLEVKCSRTSNSPSRSIAGNHAKEHSGNTDSISQTSFCEDSDSADSCQANTRDHSFYMRPQAQSVVPGGQKMGASILDSYFQHTFPGSFPNILGDGLGYIAIGAYVDVPSSLASCGDILGRRSTEHRNITSVALETSIQTCSAGMEVATSPGESLSDETFLKERQLNWQSSLANTKLLVPEACIQHTPPVNLSCGNNVVEQKTQLCVTNSLKQEFDGPDSHSLSMVNHTMQLMSSDSLSNSCCDISVSRDGSLKHNSPKKEDLQDEECLTKADSFSRWISKELGEVDDLHMRASADIPWNTLECASMIDESSLSLSLARDQLFSILDFSPKWASVNSETEVHIVGKFLKNRQEIENCKWSCMFGEVEVIAEILADGVLCCTAPQHVAARVPFYITCRNRLACSEVREFEYKVDSLNRGDALESCDARETEAEMLLCQQLERLLSCKSSGPPSHTLDNEEKLQLVSDIILLKEDNCYHYTEPILGFKPQNQNIYFDNYIKEQFYSWLIHGVTKSNGGTNVLDSKGQGVLHLAAALGYDWMIKPIILAGVSVNFRDINGWTALHWAAYGGRVETVAMLVSLGAAPGALSDPSPDFPLGRTPADIASMKGHKGISGFLAESSLTSFLSSLAVNDAQKNYQPEAFGSRAVLTVPEKTATPGNDSDVPEVLSLRDSLTAISNATQAANRIHQIFRLQSFHQRKAVEDGGDETYERILASVSSKVRKSACSDGVAHKSAIQIQKKFRGWKKRREFLVIRQRIVKIQAHVRGHQVRKQYRTIIWSVGILEKIILRWRRKGSGLRGFRRDEKDGGAPSEEDDYDFLKVGKKQSEERTQKALSRVKSMFQYPEGRAQYRRLLTVVEGYRVPKDHEMFLNSTEGIPTADPSLVDIESLLEDESFMSMVFE